MHEAIYCGIHLPVWHGGGRVVRRCWVNFQCRGILLVWMIVGQGPIALAVGGGCLDIFILVYLFSFLSPFLWETARYRLKYCLKGPLNPKQPTNQPCMAEKLQKFHIHTKAYAKATCSLMSARMPQSWMEVQKAPMSQPKTEKFSLKLVVNGYLPQIRDG